MMNIILHSTAAQDSGGDAGDGKEHNIMSDATIDQFLHSQSVWVESDRLWRRALDSRRSNTAMLTKPISQSWLGVVAAAAIIMIVVGIIFVPSLGKARASARMLRNETAPSASVSSNASEFPGLVNAYNEQPAVGGSSNTPAIVERTIIRKDSVDIEAKDVHATFAKVAALINEAAGEYIQDARQTGRAPYNSAQLTLRVGAKRLGEVLVELTQLGTITQQTTTGTDVTDQVVDIEARLRNERRIEQEMLELLNTRGDAPLKDVLDVRDHLARIRGEIERLTGQRDQLSRLATLATIVVSITAERVETPAASSGLLDDFAKQVAQAWKGGLRMLTASIAFIISVIVGGAVFWVLIGVLVIAILMFRRRGNQAAAREHAPMLGE